MATITELGVRLVMHASGFGFVGSRAATTLTRIAGESDLANRSLKETAASAAGAASAFDRATRSARGYLRVASGGAIGGISLARAVKAGAKEEQTETNLARKSGGAQGVVTVVEAWKKLGQVVDKAFAAFGRAFNQASGLSGFLLKMSGAIEKFQPLLRIAGDAFGTVVGIILRMGEVLVPVIAGLHLLGPPAVFLVKVLVLGSIMRYFLGFTPLTLAWAAATKILNVALVVTNFLTGLLSKFSATARSASLATMAWSAAQWFLNGALKISNVLMGILAVVGLPVWAAVAIVVAAVTAAVYLLIKAWSWFTGSEAKVDTGNMQAIADEANAAAKASDEAKQRAADLFETVRQNARTAGWGEAAKDVDAYARSLAKATNMSVDEKDVLMQQFRTYQKINAEADALKMNLDKRAEIAKELRQLEMTDGEKKLDDLRHTKGIDHTTIRAAEQAQRITDEKAKWAAREEEASTIVANIQKEAAEWGMTEAQKRLAALQKVANSEKQITDFRKAQAEIANKEGLKKLVGDLRGFAKVGGGIVAQINQTRRETAKGFIEDSKGPLEKYNEFMSRLDASFKLGDISKDVYDKQKFKALGQLDTTSEYKPIAALERGSAAAFSAIQSNRGPKTEQEILKAAQAAHEQRERHIAATLDSKPQVSGVRR